MTISSLFPDELKTFFIQFEKVGAKLCLVGGAARDFISSRELSHDLDFEVRGKTAEEIKQFLDSAKIVYEELPYSIFKFDRGDFNLEFSLPREEKPIAENLTHHHFEAKTSSDLSYERAFARRDFTINAIGIEFDFSQGTEQTIDPYGGIQDLSDQVLREVSAEFFLDPVRFLRLIRFKVKYGYVVAESISTNLNRFDLSRLSFHHLKKELEKSLRPGEFLILFSNLIKSAGIKLESNYQCLLSIHFTGKEKNHDDILVSALLESETMADEVAAFFLMPLKKVKELKSFYHSYQKLKKASETDWKDILEKPEPLCYEAPLVKELKNYFEKISWTQKIAPLKNYDINEYEKIVISAEVLEEVAPPWRSYLKVLKYLKGMYSVESKRN